MVEFGTGLRARLAKDPMASNGPRRRLVERPDLRHFYELLASEALVFRSFEPTAPRLRSKLAQRLPLS